MQNSWQTPTSTPLEGAHVSLLPLDVERDVDALFALSHGNAEKDSVWRYLPYGPFADTSEMRAWMQRQFNDSSGELMWTARHKESQQYLGVSALLNIVPEHGRAEIGHVWFSPSVHKTKINTETQYLLLRYLFGDLRYRRAEWKCDAQNHASRTTAARMGFSFEGRFRQHMMKNGKNRDTDWFAMTDKDWPRCKANFETWLASDGGVSLSQLNSG